jgi:flagella synthesis protein FlgN
LLRQPAAANRSAFVSSLRSELAAFRELHQVLQSEHDCLMRSDVDALLKLIEPKSQQLERLAALAAVRSAYLDSVNLPADRAGMAQWLTVYAGPEAPGLADVWNQLLALATKARALNEANGALVASQLNHNKAALAALRSAARTLSTYGPDGHPEPSTGQRELGKA